MVVVKKYPKSILSEAYRNLRTNLEYSSIDKKIKTLVVTSVNQGEGKSTVVCNLAYSLCNSSKKVLIIDCDLRKPTIHKRFRLSNLAGLTDYLVNKVQFKHIVKIVEENLHVITSGKIPPNPAEVVDSKEMQNLLEKLKEFYDYIIIDTPPVRVVADGQILAGKCDGTLLVVRAEKTEEDSVVQGYKELKKVKANVIGSILNNVPIKMKDSYYYYARN